MSTQKLVDPEYRRAFNFLQLFRVVAVVHAAIIFSLEKQLLTAPLLAVLIFLAVYTFLFLYFRNQILDMLTARPALYAVDIAVAFLALISTSKPSFPFYPPPQKTTALAVDECGRNATADVARCRGG